MYKNMKRILITVCCLFVTAAATAQKRESDEASKHELSVYGTAGYSPISCTVPVNGKPGAGAGIGYTHSINPSLGIVFGIELMRYNSEISFGDVSGEYTEGTGYDLFRFTYSLHNYRQTQSITMFSVPVMAQYGLPLGSGSTLFYVSGGFKFGFPVRAKAKTAPGTVTASGYFAREIVEYDDFPSHGFGKDIPFQSSVGNIGFGYTHPFDFGFTAATLALETGVRFTLTGKIRLYAGLYFDYGLNNIQEENYKNLLEYNTAESSFVHNSVLNTGMVDKIKLINTGLKIKVGLGL
jgi:hypothetical protein